METRKPWIKLRYDDGDRVSPGGIIQSRWIQTAFMENRSHNESVARYENIPEVWAVDVPGVAAGRKIRVHQAAVASAAKNGRILPETKEFFSVPEAILCLLAPVEAYGEFILAVPLPKDVESIKQNGIYMEGSPKFERLMAVIHSIGTPNPEDEFTPGDIVCYKPIPGQKEASMFSVDNETYILLKRDDILAISGRADKDYVAKLLEDIERFEAENRAETAKINPHKVADNGRVLESRYRLKQVGKHRWLEKTVHGKSRNQ
jgi:co-chaperonin GroES (HSP10)